MKRILFTCVVLGFAIACGTAPALAADKGIVPGEAIVVPTPGVTIDEIVADYRATVIDQYVQSTGTTVYLLRLRSDNRTAKQVRRLQADVRVASASTNKVMRTPTVGRHSPISFPFDRATLVTPDPHDPSGYDGQAFITNLRVGEALAMSRGNDVVVAILDTGVDVSGHAGLAARIWTNPIEEEDGDDEDNEDGMNLVDDVRGWDFYDDDADPTEFGTDTDPAYGHGTFIAGIVAKLAPDARIMPLRVFGPDGTADAWDVARALRYAVAHGASVVNMSFGSDEDLDPIHDAVNDAKDYVVLVGAAGNAAGRTQFPARRSEVIAVAAVTDQNQKATFTNFGSDVDVAAPGVQLRSMYPRGRFAIWSGTSFAAPIVSATAALRIARVKAAVPDLDHEDLIKDAVDAIEDNTFPLSDDGLGRGRVDIVKALQARLPGDGGGGGGDDVVSESITLTGRSSETGTAERVRDATGERLTVTGERLDSGDRYTIWIDGAYAGSGVATSSSSSYKGSRSGDGSDDDEPGDTDDDGSDDDGSGDDDSDDSSDDGSLTFTFSSADGSMPAFLTSAFDVVLVEVRDDKQRTALSGRFLTGTGSL